MWELLEFVNHWLLFLGPTGYCNSSHGVFLHCGFAGSVYCTTNEPLVFCLLAVQTWRWSPSTSGLLARPLRWSSSHHHQWLMQVTASPGPPRRGRSPWTTSRRNWRLLRTEEKYFHVFSWHKQLNWFTGLTSEHDDVFYYSLVTICFTHQTFNCLKWIGLLNVYE